MKKKCLTTLLAAAVLTAAAGFGLLTVPDSSLSDALYQSARAQDGEIVVIGMDQRALETLGPLPWSRSVMARAVSVLNADPANRPAVIGIDILYVGESDPEADAALVRAAKEGGNVVTAAAATFGSSLITDASGGFYLDDAAVLAWDEPFPALKAVTQTGHINAMFDTDGIIRRAMLNVKTKNGIVPSFSRVLYERYAAASGLPVNDPPETRNGFFYLDFSARPGDFYDGVSVSDLLAGTVSSDYFANKIVLIGPYAAGMQDAYPTAIDHAKPMYGIEIQANAIAAMLHGVEKTEVSNTLQLVLLFILSALALFWLLDRKMLPATVVAVLVIAGWLALCAGLYRAGYVLHALWVPLAMAVLYVAAVAVNYIRAAMEKRRVTSTFSRYVDPAIISELLKEDSEALGLGGKLTDISVLFVDIRGFTSMSEVLTPPQVVEVLNQYLSLTAECVMRNRGTLDKFVGDCTMAIWNAPLAQEDYVYLSCRAALDMVERAKPLTEKLERQFGRTVSFGVGVHCGPAVVGNIGAEMRMDFTAIGDTVNTAARLEANAPGGTVYISRAVADALGDRAKTTSLGSTIKLKGKADGFEILTLDALSDS